MPHRFKLLFITSLIGLSLAPHSLAPHAVASSLLSDKSLARSDRLPLAPRANLKRSIVAIEQPIARSPLSPPSSSPSSATPLPAAVSRSDWLGWGAMGLLPIAVVAGVLYALRFKNRNSQNRQQDGQQKQARSLQAAIESESETNSVSSTDEKPDEKFGEAIDKKTDEEQPSSETGGSESIASPQTDLTVSATTAATTRLAKIDIVIALIQDLHCSNANQRRKAIWELGQWGDSRAIQPLVDLLVDSDSNQRGLILAAIAEISVRALKPVNRALMLSMQDASPDVRKNAIRDVTRVFELVSQTNQLLQYANSDTDAEVRKTAEWAIGQLNGIRPLTGTERIPSLAHNFVHRNGALPPLSALTESTHAEIVVNLQEETNPLREE